MKQLSKINNLIISFYLFVMLGFFPLYYRYQYANMGDEKYKIFLYASSVCVVVSFLLSVWRMKDIRIYSLDTAVILYFCSVVISFLLTDFKEFAWKGADGWFMGLLSQILFVAVYFLIAKTWTYRPWVLILLGVSSVIAFAIAILHRFDIDLLNIYGDISEYYKILFLSTMGQSSWYSGFLCTIFPVGLYLFFMEKEKKKRTLAGIYSVIAMMSLVTQNTDSAFLALFAVMMVLFYLSFDGKMKEFFEVLILVLASFCFMGICQKVFAERMIPLDTMSLFMSQSAWIWIALVAVIGIYVLLKKKDSLQTPLPGKIFWVVLTTTITAVLLVILFIIANTCGLLQNIFGFQSTNNYLLFDNYWGNGRGFAWKFAVTTFGELPFIQKLFGVGPDCFSAYAASVPEYLERMKGFWGNLVLTNVHNEYLTKLYTLGIIGLVAYITMLVTGVTTFIKSRHKNSLLPAFALCIVSYMTHNIFCYEQVCCTPFFYILIGIGSNLIHNQAKKSTY